MEKTREHKRSITVVDNILQYKLAAFAVALAGVSSLGVWWSVKRLFDDLIARGMIVNKDLSTVFEAYGQVIFLKVIMALVVVWVASLYYSNRIAGPVYRLRKTVESIKDGNLHQRMHLRKHDHFQYIAGTLNDAIDHLQARIKSEHEKAVALGERLEQAAKKTSGGIANELAVISSEVKKLNDNFQA